MKKISPAVHRLNVFVFTGSALLRDLTCFDSHVDPNKALVCSFCFKTGSRD